MRRIVSMCWVCLIAVAAIAQHQQGDKLTLSLIGASDASNFSAIVKGEIAFNLSPVLQLVPGFTWMSTHPFQKNTYIGTSGISPQMVGYGNLDAWHNQEDCTSFDLKLRTDIFRLLKIDRPRESLSAGLQPSLYFYRTKNYLSSLSEDGYTHIVTGFSSTEETGLITWFSLEYNYRISSSLGLGVMFDNPIVHISGSYDYSYFGLRVNYFIR